MKLITATEKDTNQIYELVQKTINEIYPKYYPLDVVRFFANHHRRENILNDIKSGNVYILLKENDLVGTGTINSNHITRLFVLPEYQGGGYGSYIMQCFEDIISQNYHSVLLDSSLPASQFYENRNYSTITHENIRFENGCVLVYEIMEKKL